MLATRQQEVLEAAVEVGYYSVPRESTLDDVAAVVEIAPTTAGTISEKPKHGCLELSPVEINRSEVGVDTTHGI